MSSSLRHSGDFCGLGLKFGHFQSARTLVRAKELSSLGVERGSGVRWAEDRLIGRKRAEYEDDSGTKTIGGLARGEIRRDERSAIIRTRPID